nr:hypothetical protein [Tanacetum cinerariifolium]
MWCHILGLSVSIAMRSGIWQKSARDQRESMTINITWRKCRHDVVSEVAQDSGPTYDTEPLEKRWLPEMGFREPVFPAWTWAVEWEKVESGGVESGGVEQEGLMVGGGGGEGVLVVGDNDGVVVMR